MEEWIRKIKKNCERDIFRTILEGDTYKTSLVASLYRALNIDGF